MTPEELQEIKVAYSGFWAVREQNAQRDIYALAGEIERLWMQLASVTAERDALVTWKHTLAADVAERDDTIIALKSELAAVPVGAIRELRNDAMDQDWIADAYEFHEPGLAALRTLDAWLETQVTP
jgi:chromosome segregation ATPase